MKKILTILLLFVSVVAFSQKVTRTNPFYVIQASEGGGGSSTLTTGLLGYWTLDESSGDALDEVGSNDGTVKYVTQDSTGIIDRCVYCPGGLSNPDDTSGVILNDYSEFGTAGTISLWFTNNCGGWRRSTMAQTRDDDFSEYGGWRIMMEINGSGQQVISFKIWDDADNNQYETGSTVISNSDDEAWHHVVASWDSDSIRVWLNGSQEISAATTYLPKGNTGQMRFGLSDSYLANESHIGSIDEVGVWERAFTAKSSVDSLFNSGSGLTYPFE